MWRDIPVTTDGTVDEPVQNCPECLTPIPTVTQTPLVVISDADSTAVASPDTGVTLPTPVWYEETGVTTFPDTGMSNMQANAIGFFVLVLMVAILLAAIAVQLRRNGQNVIDLNGTDAMLDEPVVEEA